MILLMFTAGKNFIVFTSHIFTINSEVRGLLDLFIQFTRY